MPTNMRSRIHSRSTIQQSNRGCRKCVASMIMRRFHDSEPAQMVLLDALALAHHVLQRPSTTLAAAM